MNKNVVQLKEDWDLVSLNHPNSKYTAEQKVAIVTSIVLGRSVEQTSKETGVPAKRIEKMKSSAAWWDSAASKVRKEMQDSLDSIMTTSLHKAMDEILDRINHGDFVKDSKTGDLVRVPMGGRELSNVANILFDKRSLIRGDATSISTKRQDPLKDIEGKLKEFAKVSSLKQD